MVSINKDILDYRDRNNDRWSVKASFNWKKDKKQLGKEVKMDIKWKKNIN